MSEDPMDKDKVDELFSEIIQSTDMNGIVEKVELEFNLNVKELAFLQESLGESIACISQIMFMVINNEASISDDILELLGNLYKLSEDLNSSMVELYIENIDEYIDDDIDDEDENYGDDGN
jgi:hypothetical protein